MSSRPVRIPQRRPTFIRTAVALAEVLVKTFPSPTTVSMIVTSTVGSIRPATIRANESEPSR